MTPAETESYSRVAPTCVGTEQAWVQVYAAIEAGASPDRLCLLLREVQEVEHAARVRLRTALITALAQNPVDGSSGAR